VHGCTTTLHALTNKLDGECRRTGSLEEHSQLFELKGEKLA
jgi:hypothetical protein